MIDPDIPLAQVQRDALVSSYGAPGTCWPQRLPIVDEGEAS